MGQIGRWWRESGSVGMEGYGGGRGEWLVEEAQGCSLNWLFFLWKLSESFLLYEE